MTVGVNRNGRGGVYTFILVSHSHARPVLSLRSIEGSCADRVEFHGARLFRGVSLFPKPVKPRALGG